MSRSLFLAVHGVAGGRGSGALMLGQWLRHPGERSSRKIVCPEALDLHCATFTKPDRARSAS